MSGLEKPVRSVLIVVFVNPALMEFQFIPSSVEIKSPFDVPAYIADPSVAIQFIWTLANPLFS